MTLSIVEQVLRCEKRAVARLITHLENKHPNVRPVLNALYAHTGRAHLIGVTGAPGTGKSSLVNKLVKTYRRLYPQKKVAVLAVDPTSPFTGGAILGDRVRMRELAGDADVFIRSMASRGSLGGLALAVDDTLKVLDAAGFDLIFIETVGAGQSEVEIARTAHTVVVVEAPGYGDDVQAIKAGILEIADIFVVNKADRPGVERTIAALKNMLELGHTPPHKFMHHGQLIAVMGTPPSPDGGEISSWKIPVLKTMALKEEGIDAVVQAIDQHYQHLSESGELLERNRNRLLDKFENSLKGELMKYLLSKLPPNYMAEISAKLADRTLAPYQAVQSILLEFTAKVKSSE